MNNPYLIQGPAQISFSGGRSSGMMLCKIVEAHGGKEREETLRFVLECELYLGVRIAWIEYDPKNDDFKFGATAMERWKQVSFLDAARDGEPFAEMVRRAEMPPNVLNRHCTAYLKIKPMEGFLQAQGISGYLRVIGLRSDEPRRVAKMRERADVALPLTDAGVTREDVVAFWKAMPFDLELPTINGETVGGNCDLCYLKGAQKIIGLIRERPESADWWIEQETRTGKLFRIDRPNYAALKVIALQPQLDFGAVQEDSLPCECVD